MKKIIVLCMLIVSLFGCSNKEASSEEQILDYSKLLYKVSSPEGNYGYLLGTIHLNKGKIEGLDKVSKEAYEDADILALEIDLDPSQASANANMMQVDPVAEALSEEELADLKEILKLYPSVPMRMVDDLNLGTINLLATQDIVKEAGYSTEYAIDSYLYKLAKYDKKKFYEFESYKEQMSMIHELGISCKELTIEGLRRKEEALEANKQMIVDYMNGDIEAITKALNGNAEFDDEVLIAQQDIYYKSMITDRNIGMFEKYKELLNKDEVVFAAVGAGHVLGEEGMLNLLEAEGYSVEPLGIKGQ